MERVQRGGLKGPHAGWVNGVEGGHGASAAHRGTASGDLALAFARAAVVVEGGQAGQRGASAPGECPDLREVPEERGLASAVGEIAKLAALPALRGLASDVLGCEAFAVRTLFFDKNPAANWKVAWHQDLTIAVCERHDVIGFGPWSVKAGIPHVQPPVGVLERMITLRLHLDDCDATNGALRVLPGSHRAGRLPQEAIQTWRERAGEVTCAVPRRGVLLMRPLLLHASAPAVQPHHRRVVHLEFAAADLPDGLEWFEKGRVPAGKSNVGN